MMISTDVSPGHPNKNGCWNGDSQNKGETLSELTAIGGDHRGRDERRRGWGAISNLNTVHKTK